MHVDIHLDPILESHEMFEAHKIMRLHKSIKTVDQIIYSPKIMSIDKNAQTAENVF